MTLVSVLDKLLEPVGQSLTPDVARALIGIRADDDTQARIDELADKCTEGTLTSAERSEYEAYVAAIELVSILQAKARRVLARVAG
jgi:inactivated superfamily I helicase